MSPEDASEPNEPVIPDSVAASSGLPDDGIGLPSPSSPDDGLAALLGSDGGLDLGSLMEQAAGLQAQFAAAQEQAQASVVEGAAGGGVVRISVTGGFEFQSVQIDPAAVDPSDVDMLQDLVLAALNDAVSQVNELQQGSLGGIGLDDLFGSWSVQVAAVYAGPVQDLIDELGRLPGVGPKSAQRIALHLLKLPKDDAMRLSRAIGEAKDRVAWCTRCFNLSEGPLCGVCDDDRRDPTVVCVVEEPRDLIAVEKTGEFRGRYHVLQGAISPIEGIGPDQLRVGELLERIKTEGITEAILCTNPNIEGEATAMYLGRLLTPLGIKVTRIASGLPVGGDLEYADELTLGRALEGRREVPS